jgi:hypothetical protein
MFSVFVFEVSSLQSSNRRAAHLHESHRTLRDGSSGWRCPENERRPITTTADGFHVAQSQGFIRLEDCDFGYLGDDCINIHDNIHSGVRRVNAHTLVATAIIALSIWKKLRLP